MSSGKPSSSTPIGWKTPGDVMRLHRLKLKQKALNARLSGNSVASKSSSNLSSCRTERTANPFKKTASSTRLEQNSQKRTRTDLEDEETNDSVGEGLFKILDRKPKSVDNIENFSSFENILSKLSSPLQSVTKSSTALGFEHVPIDWTLRSKLRFMSRKSFPWNQKLKTCEEASGITGFVRCLDNDTRSSESSTLDTSPSAQFLSTYLYWTHPHLPWLQLFPRSRLKPSPGVTSSSNLNASNSLLGSSNCSSSVLSPDMKVALHKDWVKSFMSLFHLLRAKQCPYFYLVSNSFTCLFRAAGICGITELHAILTPTTRGFRHLLREEDIEFTMPLKQAKSSVETSDSNASKRPKTSLDPTMEPLEQTQMETFSDDEIEEEQTEEWLKEMGVASSDIRRIQNTQSDLRMGEEREIDRTPESLVYVEGTEAQALFNFLVNCKSCVATTGYLTGVPPTLISPVCFHSASLQYLQVKDSTVRLEGEIYYSMEIRGPILPHAVQYMCSMLEQSQESFSLTFASVESTKPFSQIKNENTREKSDVLTSPRRNASSSIFEQQNLSDCGLRRNLIPTFCSDKSVKSYESAKYSDKMYRIV